MREETGALAPPSADLHKMKHSRKHGIMASVFSGDPGRANSAMNLELSMEINRKMQAVLEDTLLKNITLKVSALPMSAAQEHELRAHVTLVLFGWKFGTNLSLSIG